MEQLNGHAATLALSSRTGPNMPPPATSTEELAPHTILAVDDEEGIRSLLELALTQSGFKVLLASNGTGAVELYRELKDSIALVLLDVQMQHLDGPATLAALRAINPAVRCCYMSGSLGKYTTEELVAMGASHVFSKPFCSIEAFSRKLQEITAGGNRGCGEDC